MSRGGNQEISLLTSPGDSGGTRALAEPALPGLGLHHASRCIRGHIAFSSSVPVNSPFVSLHNDSLIAFEPT